MEPKTNPNSSLRGFTIRSKTAFEVDATKMADFEGKLDASWPELGANLDQKCFRNQARAEFGFRLCQVWGRVGGGKTYQKLTTIRSYLEVVLETFIFVYRLS